MRKWISAVDACSQTNFRTPKIFPCFELLYVFCLIYSSVLYICKVAIPLMSGGYWVTKAKNSLSISKVFSFRIKRKYICYFQSQEPS